MAQRFAPEEQVCIETTTETPESVATQGKYQFVHGHVGFAYSYHFTPALSVLTLLREPVERAVSKFYFLKSLADADLQLVAQRHQLPGMLNAKRLELKQFLEQEPDAANQVLSNSQTRYLCGESAPYLNTGNIDNTQLENAKKNLCSCRFVGLTERFGESVDLLCFALNWLPMRSTARMLVAKSRPAISELDRETADAITQRNFFDLQLYDFACELFEQRWQEALSQILDGPARNQIKHNQSSLRSTADRELSDSFSFDRPIPGKGWYTQEQWSGIPSAWMGPANESSLELFYGKAEPLELRIRVPCTVTEGTLDSLEVFLNESCLELEKEICNPGWLLKAQVPMTVLGQCAGRLRLVFRVSETVRPCDLCPDNQDDRYLGILVSKVEFVQSRELNYLPLTAPTTC